MADTFWLVWSPRGGKSRRRHRTFEAATAEAQRLAEQNHGRHFYVLEVVYVAMVGPEVPTARQAERERQAAGGC